MKRLWWIAVGLSLCVMTKVDAKSQNALTPPVLEEIAAKKIKHVSEFEFSNGSSWRVVVQRVLDSDQLWVQDQDSKKTHLSVRDSAERFKSLEWVRLKSRESEFLLTRWTRGVHGEEIRLYDPLDSRAPLKFQVASSWPAQTAVVSGVLKVKATRTGKTAEEPVEFEKVFP
jgi:hypothetical protein